MVHERRAWVRAGGPSVVFNPPPPPRIRHPADWGSSLRSWEHVLLESLPGVHEGVDVAGQDAGEGRCDLDALEDNFEGSRQRSGHEHAREPPERAPEDEAEHHRDGMQLHVVSHQLGLQESPQDHVHEARQGDGQQDAEATVGESMRGTGRRVAMTGPRLGMKLRAKFRKVHMPTSGAFSARRMSPTRSPMTSERMVLMTR